MFAKLFSPIVLLSAVCCNALVVGATTSPDLDTRAPVVDGADAIAYDAIGKSVGHRNIYEGLVCLNFTGAARIIDVIQVSTGHGLRVYSQANCQGLSQVYTEKGKYQPATNRLSWSVVTVN
ncbi:hypothetical protein L218DRAFT_946425 [Marasmius fiardii PR-910]|nr:hypothetical protein L218DRAFT_946425 [Marasmius fiardii PR-910]